jgi:hypothetical protein
LGDLGERADAVVIPPQRRGVVVEHQAAAGDVGRAVPNTTSVAVIPLPTLPPNSAAADERFAAQAAKSPYGQNRIKSLRAMRV